MNFQIALPTSKRVPIVLSIPHCGTAFPEAIKNEYDPKLIAFPDDTDWFVDRLYSFAPSLGITVISAVWSRWVIDLNRDPQSKPLYTDGRLITDLCPVSTFLGEPIYKDKRTAISESEVKHRKREYFDPYHNRLRELIDDVKAEFGRVLLWDCHSIRQQVPTIHAERFPDIILGSAMGRSADARLINTAIRSLSAEHYAFQHNHPFQGGYITRHYGMPERHEHALQLEMTKINYMDDSETRYDEERSSRTAHLLHRTLRSLLEILNSLKD